MKSLVSIALISSLWCSTALAQDAVYEGTWNTTNRKLDGPMTCSVKDLGDGKWTGRFYGVWQGVPFDYTVAFTGAPEKLAGKATIDGADYTWSGDMNVDGNGRFKATFGGNRYSGYFDLKRKLPTSTAAASRPALR